MADKYTEDEMARERDQCRTLQAIGEQSTVKLLRAKVWAKVFAAEFVRDVVTGPVNANAFATMAAAQFDDYCRTHGL